MRNIKIFESFEPEGRRLVAKFDEDENGQIIMKITHAGELVLEVNGDGFFIENSLDVEDLDGITGYLRDKEIIGKTDKLHMA